MLMRTSAASQAFVKIHRRSICKGAARDRSEVPVVGGGAQHDDPEDHTGDQADRKRPVAGAGAGHVAAGPVDPVLGASRAVSTRWPSTWMVMAPNHNTKLALCMNSSVWRSEWGADYQGDAAGQYHHGQDDHRGAEEAQKGGGWAFAPVGGGSPVVADEPPAGGADLEQHRRYQQHADEHVRGRRGRRPGAR